MIIERHRANKNARGVLLENAMNFAHGDRRIRQVFQDFGHHHGIEFLVPDPDMRGEIHFPARDA